MSPDDSVNPYAPPQVDVESKRPLQLPERPRRSRILVASLYAFVTLSALLIAIDLIGTQRFPGWNDMEAETQGTSELMLLGVFGLGGLAALGAFLASVVLFCMWVHRASKQARALGAKWMEFTPGWAVGYWFIPIVNLFRPYQAVKEIYLASDPEKGADDWKNGHVPNVFGLWWFTWIVSNLVSNVSMRMSFSSDPEVLATVSWIGLVEVGLQIPCAIAVVRIIRAVDARQAARAARLTGGMPDSAPNPAL